MGLIDPSGQSAAATLLIRQSHSAQSAVCVVMVDPSFVAPFPTIMAVHLSDVIASASSLGNCAAIATTQAKDTPSKARRSRMVADRPSPSSAAPDLSKPLQSTKATPNFGYPTFHPNPESRIPFLRRSSIPRPVASSC